MQIRISAPTCFPECSFKGGASHKRTAVREEIIPSEYLGKLPNAQFFASLGGGHLMKGRVPVIIDDEEN